MTSERLEIRSYRFLSRRRRYQLLREEDAEVKANRYRRIESVHRAQLQHRSILVIADRLLRIRNR